jgi:hypothetical protein
MFSNLKFGKQQTTADRKLGERQKAVYQVGQPIKVKSQCKKIRGVTI